MTKYNFTVSNDNGNSEHKIMIGNEIFHQPNVYSKIYHSPGETSDSLDVAVSTLYKHLDVRIESKAIADSNNSDRFYIGTSALSSSGSADVRMMNVKQVAKNKEDLPIINTLGILAARAVKQRYEEEETLIDGETIQLEVDMTTALPALHSSTEELEAFSERFTKHLHEVKVYVKNLAINVQIKFTNVKVLTEGVPALFNIIEDEFGNYRNDDLFVKMKEDYKHEILNGSHFAEKRLLHLDIGDGTTELVYTEGYTADPMKSKGLAFGLGQAIEKTVSTFKKEKRLDVTRQLVATYFKDPNHKFHFDSLDFIQGPKREVADRLYEETIDHMGTLNYEIDILVVYGGASILLNDILYKQLKEFCDFYNIEVLWVPAKYAVDMSVKGMAIYKALTKA